MSKLAVGQLEGLASEGYRISVASGSAFAPVGSILQVVSTTKTDKFSSSQSAGAVVDVTGLSVSITPKFSSSKILIFASVVGSLFISGTDYRPAVAVQLKRNGTPIGGGTTAGNRTSIISHSGANLNDPGNAGNANITYLDSPSSTSALTYQISLLNWGASTYTLFCNQSGADADNNYIGRPSSTITVMEVAG